MPPVKASDKSNNDEQILEQALQAFHRLPKMVFVLQVWNEVDMGSWDRMKHKGTLRLSYMNVRN